mgnify:FL=1
MLMHASFMPEAKSLPQVSTSSGNETKSSRNEKEEFEQSEPKMIISNLPLHNPHPFVLVNNAQSYLNNAGNVCYMRGPGLGTRISRPECQNS